MFTRDELLVAAVAADKWPKGRGVYWFIDAIGNRYSALIQDFITTAYLPTTTLCPASAIAVRQGIQDYDGFTSTLVNLVLEYERKLTKKTCYMRDLQVDPGRVARRLRRLAGTVEDIDEEPEPLDSSEFYHDYWSRKHGSGRRRTVHQF